MLFALAVLLGMAMPVGQSQAAPDDSQTPSELLAERQRGTQVVSSLGPGLFGDQVDLYTGALSFVQSDFDVPGNDALAVGVSRRYIAGRRERTSHFGDWDLEIPHIYGTYQRPGMDRPIGRPGPLLQLWSAVHGRFQNQPKIH